MSPSRASKSTACRMGTVERPETALATTSMSAASIRDVDLIFTPLILPEGSGFSLDGCGMRGPSGPLASGGGPGGTRGFQFLAGPGRLRAVATRRAWGRPAP